MKTNPVRTMLIGLMTVGLIAMGLHGLLGFVGVQDAR